MTLRTGLILAAVLLIAAALILEFTRGQGTSAQRLGPKDGHDLPPTDLDRVSVGYEAPDFSLRARTGEIVTLSDFRGRQEVVLVFYRGHW